MSFSRAAIAAKTRYNHIVDYHEEFKVWLKDSQKRPCFGTTEKDASRHTRSDLSRTGTKLRVIALLNVLRDADIPLNVGAMTYNAKYPRSKAFHIKYAIPPEVYVHKFCPMYRVYMQPEVYRTLAERFRKDYYGDYLHMVQTRKDSGTAVAIPTSADKLVRAPDRELLTTGPVVLFNRAPLYCADLSDEVIEEFESAVVGTFGDVWFSVCFYAAVSDAPHLPVRPDNAQICIGAKIDETKFIEIVQPPIELQEQFIKQHEYKPPTREYHSRHGWKAGKEKLTRTI